LLAVDEVERTVRAAPHHVAGMEPAVLPCFRGGLGVLEIFAEEAIARLLSGMADQKLAGFVDVSFMTMVGDDANLDFGARVAEAVGAGMTRLAASDNHRAGAGFRHRPRLDQRKAEARLERVVQRA